MTTYWSEDDPLYEQAVGILSALAEEHPHGRYDAAGRAYAQVVAPQIVEGLGRKGYTRSDYHHGCVAELLTGKCPTFGDCSFPPQGDHPSAWIKEGKIAFIMSEPYSTRVTPEYVAQSQRFAEKHGLTLRLDFERSPHFPGRTVAFIFASKGVEPQTEEEEGDVLGENGHDYPSENNHA